MTTSIGERLRRAREAIPASVYQAARDTRIRVDFLESMERGEFNFVAPTYAKGHLRSYARWLGLDEEEVAREFDEHLGNPLPATVAEIIKPTKHPKPRITRPRWVMASVTAALGLLVLSLVGIMNPVRQVAAPPAPPGDVAQSAAAPRQEAPVQPETVAEAPGLSEVTLQFNITGDKSWIEVHNDSGKLLFSDTLFSGDSKTIESAESLSVVVGNSAAVRVRVNGRDYGVLAPQRPGVVTKFRVPVESGTLSRG